MTDDPTLGADATADGATFPASDAPSPDTPGSLIGPYKLIERIGVGGMGMVYRAEQQQPVRRMVALKIIRDGADSEQVIARFEAERQALALMDHPNIARVFDAGTTESGRPYFVMELVDGLPITKYCDVNRLSIRERLELFIPVCQAIQHAHQKGIIHRDIKSSNVLVATYDGKPTPKVIDFGIAKATDQQLTEETLFTQFGMVVGTLEYMSPEQAAGSSQDIDTRSDVYSLGVLLYVLLTGVTPIVGSQMRESAYFEMLRRIREDEPPVPSSRLTDSKETLLSVSEQRKTDPERLPKLLRGELDWIVMRALEKDRTRRYETANGFARDVQRYLTGEPVEAGPPSATYRLKKFAGKNRLLLATAAAFAIILLLGAGVSIWQAVRARKAEQVAKVERDRANSEAASAKAVTDFLEKSLLSQASANQQSGLDDKPDPDIKVRTLVDRAAAGIGGKFAGQPRVEADVRGTIGETYRDLNLIAQAQTQFQKQYDLDLHALGSNDPDTLDALGNFASTDSDQGKLAEATQLKEKVVAGLTRALGTDNPRTAVAMQSLGVAYYEQGEYTKAEPLLKKVLAYQMRTLGLDNIDTLDTSDSLETLYISDQRYPEAEKLAVPSLESYKRVFGPNHPYVLRSMYGLGEVNMLQGRYPEAEALFVPVLEGNTRVFGPDHPNTLSTMGALAQVYDKQGKHAEALAMDLQMFKRRQILGADLPDTLIEEEELANFYDSNSQPAKAEEVFKDSLARMDRVFGPAHPRTLITIEDLAYHYETHGDYARAIPLEIRGRDGSIKTNGPDHRETIGFTSSLGKAYLALHQYAKAEVQLRTALASITRTQPASWKRYNLESMLGEDLAGESRFAEAEPLLLSGYGGLKGQEATLASYARPYFKDAGERLPRFYQAWGKPEKAAEWREKLKAAEPIASK